MAKFNSQLPASTKNPDFNRFNNNILFERLKLVSFMLIVTYPCFLYVDIFLLKGISSHTFKLMMTVIHFASFFASFLFILIFRFGRKQNKGLIINIYVFYYLLIGALSSLNSQLYTGNIDAYLIILFGTAVIFPIRPRNLTIYMLSIQLFFLVALFFLEKDPLMKQINSTGTAVIAFTISYAFYSYRKQDYSNQNKLKKKEESFRRLFYLNPSPLLLMNIKENQIILMNKQATEYYQLLDKDITDLNGSFLFKNDAEKDDILSRLHENQFIDHFISEQLISDSLRRWAMLHFELIDYMDDQCLLIALTDITNLKKREEELSLHASIDILTGVLNRRSGMELLQNHLNKTPEREFILCFIDINNLKTVNDQFGHSSGDELIKTVTQVISTKIKANDVLFRLAGDEFIVVFFDQGLAEAEQVWNDISKEFEKINQKHQYPYSISASHGLYHYRIGTHDTLDDMLEAADKEMYKEKVILKQLCSGK